MPISYRDYGDPFAGSFHSLKMKYVQLDEHLSSAAFLNEQDKINVFINLETAFKNLSMLPDLEQRLILNKRFPTILVSHILNLAGHYKRFFVNNGIRDTRIYLYHTDLTSDDFTQRRYNDDYRSYYLVKYNENPKLKILTDALKEIVLPRVATICDFLPRIYSIQGKNIEGSAIPLIVGQDDPSRKNIIISGEYYDTQYSLLDKYFVEYIHFGIGVRSFCPTPKAVLSAVTKRKGEELSDLVKLYTSTYSFYTALLSVLGDKVRSIDGISGVGPMILRQNLLNGIDDQCITADTSNPVILGSIFHDENVKRAFVDNYYCTNIPHIVQEASQSHIASLLNQRKDRFDNNSLLRLNSTEFYHYPLTLEALTL